MNKHSPAAIYQVLSTGVKVHLLTLAAHHYQQQGILDNIAYEYVLARSVVISGRSMYDLDDPNDLDANPLTDAEEAAIESEIDEVDRRADDARQQQRHIVPLLTPYDWDSQEINAVWLHILANWSQVYREQYLSILELAETFRHPNRWNWAALERVTRDDE